MTSRIETSKANQKDSHGTAATQPLFRVRRANRVFHVGHEKVHAIDDVSIEIGCGEMVLIEGKSGSGKTTLLNLLGGLDRVSSGEVLFKNQNIGEISEGELTRWRKRHIGFVFQAFALLPGLTAFENVELAGRIAGLGPRESANEASDRLEIVGMAERANHRISELSGGEQQRVALSRGLVGNPEVVLADEPTGELDHSASRKVLDILRHLVDQQGLTVCLTSHDPAVRGYAHRTYTLEDGRIIQQKVQPPNQSTNDVRQ